MKGNALIFAPSKASKASLLLVVKTAGKRARHDRKRPYFCAQVKQVKQVTHVKKVMHKECESEE